MTFLFPVLVNFQVLVIFFALSLMALVELTVNFFLFKLFLSLFPKHDINHILIYQNMTFIIVFIQFVIYFYNTVRKAKRSAAVQRESIVRSDEQVGRFLKQAFGLNVLGLLYPFKQISAFQPLIKNRFLKLLTY